MTDELFFEDAREAVEDLKDPQKSKLLIWVLIPIVLLVFILSIVPFYSIKVNPPPDRAAVDNFAITSAEKAKLELINYAPTSSIPEAIKQVAVSDYRDIAVRLSTSACKVSSELCYAKAIYYYVQGKASYVSDPKVQYVQSPAETLLNSGGDCEDKSLAVAAMLEAIGIDADVGVTSDHAFARAQLSDAPFWLRRNSDYVWLDPSSDSEFSKISFDPKEVTGFLEVA